MWEVVSTVQAGNPLLSWCPDCVSCPYLSPPLLVQDAGIGVLSFALGEWVGVYGLGR